MCTIRITIKQSDLAAPYSTHERIPGFGSGPVEDSSLRPLPDTGWGEITSPVRHYTYLLDHSNTGRVLYST